MVSPLTVSGPFGFAQVARPGVDGAVRAGHRFRAHAGVHPVPAAVRLAAGGRVRDVPPVLRVRARSQVGAARRPGLAGGRLLGASAVDERHGRVQGPEEAAVSCERGPERGSRVGHHALRAAVGRRALSEPGRHRRFHGPGPQTGPAAPAAQTDGVPVADIRAGGQHAAAGRQKGTGKHNYSAIYLFSRPSSMLIF